MRSVLILVAAMLTGCAAVEPQPTNPAQGVPDMHDSRNSLDWAGVYRGVLPCADCPGIETRVSVQRDGSFERTTRYLGKGDRVFVERGRFEWDAEGRRVLTRADDGGTQWYQVGEGRLFHLDRDGNRVRGELAGHYVLEKNRTDPRLEGRRWVLFELMGEPVTPAQSEGRGQAFIEFDAETGRAAGSASCNRFFGGYELLDGDRVRFGQFGSTMMACPDMATEQAFMRVLEQADNYSVVDGVLSLSRAGMQPLARFRASQ